MYILAYLQASNPTNYDTELFHYTASSFMLMDLGSPRGVQLRVGRSVNPDCNVTNHSLGDIFSINWDNVHNWIVSICESTGVVVILSIGGAVNLSVACIRFLSQDCLNHILIEIELTDGVWVSSCNGTIRVENVVGENYIFMLEHGRRKLWCETKDL